MTNTGVLPGVNFSRGYALNDSGVVVGESDNNIPKAFRYEAGVLTNIGTLGGASAVAHDINNAGTIVGISSNGTVSRPFRTAGGALTDLGTIDGLAASSGRAWGLNEAGAAVGLSRATPTLSQATLWTTTGAAVNLGSAGPGLFSQAYALNASEVAVGSSVVGKVSPTSSTSLYHATKWAGGAITDLAPQPLAAFPTYLHSEARDINDSGLSVGYFAQFFNAPTFGGRAVRWNPDNTVTDLNSEVDPGTSIGWVLQSAEGINDYGDIIGYGSFGGSTRASLLVVPEPGRAMLLAFAGLGMMRRRRRV